MTVVMPALNGAATIARALASVAAQTLQPARVIVVDDGSTDETRDVAAAAEKDLEIVVLRNDKPLGSGPSRNRAIKAAETKWVAFLDCDDEWYPEHLSTTMSAAHGYVLVTSPGYDSDGQVRGNASGSAVDFGPARCLVPDNIVFTSATIVDRDAVIAAGGFRQLPRAQDLDLWCRLLEQGRGLALGVPSATYHLRPSHSEVDFYDQNRQGVEQILRDYRDRSWMTRKTHDGCLARMCWDDMRLSQRDRRWADLLRGARWFALHPAGILSMGDLLRARRRARLTFHSD